MAFNLGSLATAITPAIQARGGYLQGQQEGQDIALKRSLAALQQQRQAQQDALAARLNEAQVGHLHAQTEAAKSGQWGNAFPGEDESGPGLFQEHKQTGEVRRVKVGGEQPSAAPASPVGTPTEPVEPVVGPPTEDQQSQQSAPKTLAQSLPKASGGIRPFIKPPQPIVIDKGKSQAEIPGTPEWQAAERFKAGLIPRDDKTLVQVADPNDPTKTIYVHRSEAAGLQAPAKTGMGGGQSLAPEDRAKMLNQAKLDHATMKAYEDKVMATGQAPGMVAGAAGIMAGAAPSGTMGGLVGLAGNKATGMIDPEYQRYITAQRSYGRIMGNLQSKRYTDHQAEIERSISGLQGNDLNGTIQYKQQLRESSLADPTITPSGGGRSGGAGKPMTSGTQIPKAGTSGNVSLGAKPPLAERVQQLKAAGISKAAAVVQLQHEGYDLSKPPGEE